MSDSQTSSQQTFEPLVSFEDEYEILNEYPFTIRRRDDHTIAEEFKRGMGYITVKLNGVLKDKHKLIAIQFIPNDDPEHKTEVDHKNKHRDDNHLENLRWVTRSKNLENRSKANGITYEFVNELPDDVIKVDYYQSKKTYYEFEDDKYYYDIDEEVFYTKIDENIYKKLYVCLDQHDSEVAYLRDADNRRVGLYVKIFKVQHDLA